MKTVPYIFVPLVINYVYPEGCSGKLIDRELANKGAADMKERQPASAATTTGLSFRTVWITILFGILLATASNWLNHPTKANYDAPWVHPSMAGH